jgi:hypothetical protein
MKQKISRRDAILITVTATSIFCTFFSVIYLWQSPLLLTPILFAISAIELFVISSKKLWIIFIISGIGGATIEAISIYFGIWSYNIQSFLGIPFWLIPLWGFAGVYIVTVYKLLSKLGWFEKRAT